MSVLEDFKSASIFGKIGLILLCIASLFICIAFTCTGWGESNNSYGGIHWGLWRRCGKADFDSSGCSNLDGWANDWWAFTQAASCFGFFGTLISFFLLILYIFVSKCQKNTEVVTAAAIICFISGGMQLLGCIVFGAEWDDHYKDSGTFEFWLSYAFGLAIVASLLDIVSGVLLVLECKKGGGGGTTSASA